MFNSQNIVQGISTANEVRKMNNSVSPVIPDTIRIVPIKEEIKFIKKYSPMDQVTVNKNEKLIHGIMSAEVPDRAEEITECTAFRIPSFMAKPILYVNHKPWKDKQGNDVAAGIPTNIVSAVLFDDPTDDKLFVVKSLDDQVIHGYYPKNKAPELKSGDRVVWFSAKVTKEEVFKMVEDGELAGLSWRGISKTVRKTNPKTGKFHKYHTDIDLTEVSLVNRPLHGMATCMVAKNIDGNSIDLPDELDVLALCFDKTKFNNSQVKEYMKGLMAEDKIVEDNNNYYSITGDLRNFDSEKVVSTPLMEGAVALVGSAIGERKEVVQNSSDKVLPNGVVSYLQRIFSQNPSAENQLLKAQEKNSMETNQTVPEKVVVDPPVEVAKQLDTDAVNTDKKIDTEGKEAKEDTNKEVVQDEATVALESLASTVSQKLQTLLSPLFDELAKGLNAIGDRLQSFKESSLHLEELISKAIQGKTLDTAKSMDNAQPVKANNTDGARISTPQLQEAVERLSRENKEKDAVIEEVSKALPTTEHKSMITNKNPSNKNATLYDLSIFKRYKTSNK